MQVAPSATDKPAVPQCRHLESSGFNLGLPFEIRQFQSTSARVLGCFSMPDEQFSDYIRRERDRLNAERETIFTRRQPCSAMLDRD